MSRFVGMSLEEDFLENGKYPEAESFPCCDAIVVMGGGVGGNTNLYGRAILHAGADRAYFAALLWKAGKAPLIIPSGEGVYSGDRVMMLDLGVPESAIIVENKAANTEQNACYVKQVIERCFSTKMSASKNGELSGKCVMDGKQTRILLVTSAWHMKRSVLMFRKYAPEIEVVPAPCDFECAPDRPWSIRDLLPDPESFARNSIYIHEWIGYWGYRWLR